MQPGHPSTLRYSCAPPSSLANPITLKYSRSARSTCQLTPVCLIFPFSRWSLTHRSYKSRWTSEGTRTRRISPVPCRPELPGTRALIGKLTSSTRRILASSGSMSWFDNSLTPSVKTIKQLSHETLKRGWRPRPVPIPSIQPRGLHPKRVNPPLHNPPIPHARKMIIPREPKATPICRYSDIIGV